MATSNQLGADLRNHPELQPFLLRNVTFTGKTIGRGSYGSVDEVTIPGAAKKIHDSLSVEDSQWMSKEMVDKNVCKFVEECKMMSRLRHPNIVQFLGVFFRPASSLPVLVMEKLLMSLHSLLDPDEQNSFSVLGSIGKAPKIPLSLKCSILHDIARGIAYLHSQSPPVAHRDLSARNVLLNAAMEAKIADLGMARIVPSRKVALMTKAPGAAVYMPPEALEDKSKYDVSIDMFSLGVLAIFVLTQQFPHELKAATYFDEAKGSLVARSELERRIEYMENVYSKFPKSEFPKSHPLIQMIEQCLKNRLKARPTINQALKLLKHAEAAIQDFSNLRLHKLQLLQEVEQMAQILELKEQGAQPDLETMQQKCDAWREEVEELTPLRDEVAHLHQENARLQEEVARASEDNAGLGRQLQEMSSARRQRAQLELETMQQKCDAWREEVEKLTPLRDEVTHLHQENARLQQEVARTSEDNTGLGRQLQESRSQLRNSSVAEEELHSRIAALNTQLESLTAKFEEKDRELVAQERQIKEMKNMNAALENQLTEYMDALEHQNKSVQRTMATKQAKVEQESAQMAEYIRQQQLQYQEAQKSLQNKQTQLELELESMQQKCDAWREEVEELTPLRDEVAHLHQENARLQQEVARVSEDNAGLGRQLQEMSSARRQVGELERKAAEYDQLMDRVTELQHVRVELENELGPLRGEHTATLAENAVLQQQLQEAEGVTMHEETTDIEYLETPADERGLASSTRVHVAPPTVGVAPSDHCQVQFMWQPRKQMSHSKVILLSSFEPSSVNLTLDRDGGHYYSVQLSIPSGSYDGQLVVGESSIHPVKKFNVNTESGGKVVLEFDVATGREKGHGSATGGGAKKQHTASSSKSSSSSLGSSGRSGMELRNLAKQTSTDGAVGAGRVSYYDRQPSQYENWEVTGISGGGGRDAGGHHGQNRDGAGHVNYHGRHSSDYENWGIVSGRGGGDTGQAYHGSYGHHGQFGTEVMKNGEAVNMIIQKPQYELNPEHKPKVIVKRAAGKYETGTLKYIGLLKEKQMAGVELDIPSGQNDGCYTDGIYYFNCHPDHGLYCPLSDIYIEADSTSIV